MIYCNLKGGLGNMLFQIAATKSISIDYETDCSFPNLNNHLRYLDSDNTYNPKLKHSSEYKDLLKNLNSTNIDTSSIMRYPFEYSNKQLPDNNIIIAPKRQIQLFINTMAISRAVACFIGIATTKFENLSIIVKIKRCPSILATRGPTTSMCTISNGA